MDMGYRDAMAQRPALLQFLRIDPARQPG